MASANKSAARLPHHPKREQTPLLPRIANDIENNQKGSFLLMSESMSNNVHIRHSTI